MMALSEERLRCLEERNLVVSPEKTKVMVFEKRGGKRRREDRRTEGNAIFSAHKAEERRISKTHGRQDEKDDGHNVKYVEHRRENIQGKL